MLQRLEMCADLINRRHSHYGLADLGCRTMDLKPLLLGCHNYIGTDLVPGKDVVQCNLEKGLPEFETNSYDVVVALDVLEHLENCHALLEDMMRVARKTVYISLPNMYYLSFRLQFLFKGHLSGKYAFPVEKILDRHRWVLSFSEAVEFIDHNTRGKTVHHHKIVPKRGRSKFIMQHLEPRMANLFPNLFVYGSIHEILLEQ